MNPCVDGVDTELSAGFRVCVSAGQGRTGVDDEICVFLNLVTGPHASWDRTAAMASCLWHPG